MVASQVTPGAPSVSAPFYVLHGARFLVRHSVLWKYAVAPLVISTGLLGTAYYLIYAYLSTFLGGLLGEQWYFQVLYYAVLLLIVAVIFVVTFFIFTQIASTIAAPFNDLMSEKVEQLARGTFDEAPFSVIQLVKDVGRGIGHSVKLLGLYLILLLFGLVLLIIPGIGQILFSAIVMVTSAYLFAYEYLGYPMDRRRYSFAEKRAFLKSRRASSMGFGFGNLVAASIPGVNLLFIPAAVAGGTLLFLDLEKRGGR